MRWQAARAWMAVPVAGALAACGDAMSSPPRAQDVQEAMQVFIGERDGSVDSRGRYRGPYIRAIRDLKCKPSEQAQGVFNCSFEYDYTEGRNRSSEKTQRLFHIVPVKVIERDKEVVKKQWRVRS